MRRTVLLSMLFAMGVVSLWGQAAKLQPDENGVYPGWNGVKVASLIHGVPAVTPDDPRLEGSKHVCALLVEIGADGILKRIAVANKVASPFDEAAITAVRQSQFEPGSFNGKPVTTRLIVWVPFLGKNEAAVPVSGSATATNHATYLKNLTDPVLVKSPEAEFSEEALRDHYSGVVVFQILLSEDGLPARIEPVVRAGEGLDDNALAAVRKYRFNPATLDGMPVPFLITVEVNFRFGSLNRF